MSSIWIFRHQSGGHLHEFPHASKPTEAQEAAMAERCVRLYGKTHPKEGVGDYFLYPVEVQLLGSDALVPMPVDYFDEKAASLAKVGKSNVALIAAYGTAKVGK